MDMNNIYFLVVARIKLDIALKHLAQYLAYWKDSQVFPISISALVWLFPTPDIHMLKSGPSRWWYEEVGVGGVGQWLDYDGRALVMGLVPSWKKP